MKWSKEIKNKIITLIITLTVSTVGTAGIVFSCSGEVKPNNDTKINMDLTEADN